MLNATIDTHNNLKFIAIIDECTRLVSAYKIILENPHVEETFYSYTRAKKCWEGLVE
jgi:hypothetical protein